MMTYSAGNQFDLLFYGSCYAGGIVSILDIWWLVKANYQLTEWGHDGKYQTEALTYQPSFNEDSKTQTDRFR